MTVLREVNLYVCIQYTTLVFFFSYFPVLKRRVEEVTVGQKDCYNLLIDKVMTDPLSQG